MHCSGRRGDRLAAAGPRAVREHRCGVPDLTPRHWELLQLVAGGATNTQIGRRLGISEGTVRTHMENIFERLQVSSRAAALARAFPEHTAERLSVSR